MNKRFAFFVDSILFWAVMMIVFIYLLNHDISNAPEFIYNQF